MDRAGRVVPADTEVTSEQASGLSPEIVQLLEQPLDRKLVARRKSPTGEVLRYLELCGMEPKA